MKKHTLTPLLLLGLLLPAFASAALPSQDVIDRVKSHMEVLKANPDSQGDLDALFAEIKQITHEYGFEGTAWVAYHDPVLLESFIKPEFMGLENTAIPLLSLANGEGELMSMLTELARAQVVIHMNPMDRRHVAILKEGAKASSVNLDGERMDQVISEAITAGIERGEADVEAALSVRTTIMLLERLRDILSEEGAAILIPLINRIISRLEVSGFE